MTKRRQGVTCVLLAAAIFANRRTRRIDLHAAAPLAFAPVLVHKGRLRLTGPFCEGPVARIPPGRVFLR